MHHHFEIGVVKGESGAVVISDDEALDLPCRADAGAPEPVRADAEYGPRLDDIAGPFPDEGPAGQRGILVLDLQCGLVRIGIARAGLG